MLPIKDICGLVKILVFETFKFLSIDYESDLASTPLTWHFQRGLSSSRVVMASLAESGGE